MYPALVPILLAPSNVGGAAFVPFSRALKFAGTTCVTRPDSKKQAIVKSHSIPPNMNINIRPLFKKETGAS